ncbi:hypothetical protein, partial [Streptomyces venezuelae]|uniref:hypothetical protein n=1 Tax=Streptomyces venezuelae TaxID=54571 RepID=UPI001F1B7F99
MTPNGGVRRGPSRGASGPVHGSDRSDARVVGGGSSVGRCAAGMGVGADVRSRTTPDGDGLRVPSRGGREPVHRGCRCDAGVGVCGGRCDAGMGVDVGARTTPNGGFRGTPSVLLNGES